MKKRVCKFLPCSTYDLPAVSNWLREQAMEGLMFDTSIFSLCFFTRREPVDMKFSLLKMRKKKHIPGYNRLGQLCFYNVLCTSDSEATAPEFYTKDVLLGAKGDIFFFASFVLFFFVTGIINWNILHTQWRATLSAIFIGCDYAIVLRNALPAIMPRLRGRYYRHPALTSILFWVLFAAAGALLAIPNALVK